MFPNFNNPNYFNFNMNSNPMAYQAMQNMMLMMNPNLDINNPTNFNNMMIEFLRINPIFYQIFLQQQNLQNFNQIGVINPRNFNNNSNNNNNNNKKNGLLPRPKNQLNSDIISSPDLFPGNNESRINIQFITGTGHKMVIAAPINTSVNELFTKYICQVGVNPNYLGNKIYFVINAEYIPVNERRTIKECIMKYNQAGMIKILVLDASNLIGAKSQIK